MQEAYASLVAAEKATAEQLAMRDQLLRVLGDQARGRPQPPPHPSSPLLTRPLAICPATHTRHDAHCGHVSSFQARGAAVTSTAVERTLMLALGEAEAELRTRDEASYYLEQSLHAEHAQSVAVLVAPWPATTGSMG